MRPRADAIPDGGTPLLPTSWRHRLRTATRCGGSTALEELELPALRDVGSMRAAVGRSDSARSAMATDTKEQP